MRYRISMRGCVHPSVYHTRVEFSQNWISRLYSNKIASETMPYERQFIKWNIVRTIDAFSLILVLMILLLFVIYYYYYFEIATFLIHTLTYLKNGTLT